MASTPKKPVTTTTTKTSTTSTPSTKTSTTSTPSTTANRPANATSNLQIGNQTPAVGYDPNATYRTGNLAGKWGLFGW